MGNKKVTNIDQMKTAATQIANWGVKNVLVTGGHLKDQANDVLFAEGEFCVLEGPRLETQSGIRSTGCALPAAITALLTFK